MIEFVKMLVDTAGKLLPVSDILKQRRADEVAGIGLRLFDLYTDVIRVSQNGYHILSSLKYAVERHNYYYEQNSNDPNKPIEAVNQLKGDLHRQKSALKSLIESFNKLHPLAEIAEASADSSAYHKVDRMINQKLAIIVYMEDALLWLSVEVSKTARLTGEQVQALVQSRSTHEEMRHEQEKLAWLQQFGEAVTFEREIFLALSDGDLLEKIPWDVKINKIAEIYIESGVGHRRLDSLVDCAGEFRANVQKNFKLEDVMIAAERRLKKERDRRGFRWAI